MANNKELFNISVKHITGEGLLLKHDICREDGRFLPHKKTLDSVEKALFDRSVKKIVIYKLDDYSEGDIF